MILPVSFVIALKTLIYFPLNPGCLLGILMSCFMKQSPHNWVVLSSPIYTLNNQNGPFPFLDLKWVGVSSSSHRSKFGPNFCATIVARGWRTKILLVPWSYLRSTERSHMTSIFHGEPSKTRPKFQSKQGSSKGSRHDSRSHDSRSSTSRNGTPNKNPEYFSK